MDSNHGPPRYISYSRFSRSKYRYAFDDLWVHMDSNHGPPRYKLGALTAELCTLISHSYHFKTKTAGLSTGGF